MRMGVFAVSLYDGDWSLGGGYVLEKGQSIYLCCALGRLVFNTLYYSCSVAMAIL